MCHFITILTQYAAVLGLKSFLVQFLHGTRCMRSTRMAKKHNGDGIISLLGEIKMSKLATPTAVLILLIVVIYWATLPSDKGVGVAFDEQEPNHLFKVLDDKEIQVQLNSMRDTRPDSCTFDEYDKYEDKVTILLDFHEHQFYSLKMTLESIVKFTPDELYSEIVLLDDGTGTERVRQDAQAYMNQPKFSKVKAYRSDNADGPALTRFKASKVATGNILVFLSSDVAVNKDWLPPLIDAIRSDRHSIAVPHFDSLLSGYRFFQIADNLINIFSWTLTTLYTETNQQGKFLKTPVMTGEAFAVDHEFLDNIGNFDEGITHGGGEALELSMRTWMCGGSIKIVSCSRVAVKNALEPHKVENGKNFRRIVDLWLESYRTLAYRQNSVSTDMDETESQSFRTRRMYLKKKVTCDSFREYLKRTVNELQIPPDDARYFGKLKSKTGYCLKHSEGDDPLQSVKMVHCRPHMYETDMLVTLDTKGRLKLSGDCLDLLSNTDLQFVKCDKKRNEQQWILTGDGQLKSAVNNQMCLKHSIGQDEYSKHYLGVSQCIPDERNVLWEFIKY